MMADDSPDEKGEVTKDVLAPADDSPREDLISTAVKFLQNPKVKQSPLHQKKGFLQRKGLTQEEIDIAVQRSGALQDEKVTQVFPPQPAGQVAPYSPHNIPNTALVYTRWQKTRDILSVIALASGVTYAAYRFFKDVITPWWLGKPRTEERLERMEKSVTELQGSVVDTLTKIQECLTALQEQMAKDQEKVQNLSHEVYTIKKFGKHTYQSNEKLQYNQDSQSLVEIKSDLTSIKGLLLNRSQFPPTPSKTPVLPSWQLASSATAVEKPSLVTPSGDSGSNMSDALAMLNNNDSNRTEAEDESDVKKTVTFSENSLTNSIENSDQQTETSDKVPQSNGVDITEVKQVTKTSEDELD